MDIGSGEVEQDMSKRLSAVLSASWGGCTEVRANQHLKEKLKPIFPPMCPLSFSSMPSVEEKLLEQFVFNKRHLTFNRS